MNRRNNLRMTNGMPQYPPPFQHNSGMRPGTHLPPNHGAPINRPPMHYGNQQQTFTFQDGFPPPMQRGPGPQPKGEGILSKLKRKSQRRENIAPAPRPFSLPASSTRNATSVAADTAAASGGIFKNIMNPENLSTMLNNTQKVLQATESLTPYVQQYAPFMKNIPALWKQITGTQQVEDQNIHQPIEPQKEMKKKEQPIVKKNVRPVTIEEKTASPLLKTNKTLRKDHYTPHIKPMHDKHAEAQSTIHWRQGESKPKLFI